MSMYFYGNNDHIAGLFSREVTWVTQDRADPGLAGTGAFKAGRTLTCFLGGRARLQSLVFQRREDREMAR